MDEKKCLLDGTMMSLQWHRGREFQEPLH